VHRERAEVGAIAIGSGTLLCDDPRLTARGAYRNRPLVRVIFDARLRTPANARIFRTLAAGPVIIVGSPEAARENPGSAEALMAAGAIVESLPDGEAGGRIRAALRLLADRGVQSLIVEGGPILHEAFWNAGVVDRVQMYVTPHVLGAAGVLWRRTPAMATVSALTDRTVRLFGEDVLIEGYVHGID
jgi:diaminohydroxyphosphoribosylaminopyrimidine deaminase/5-amino-6-(5-phosphoribosylamino)uracil reductase